ncbi:phosphotransferase family protein [Nonomuraea sp. KM88]|uniref:phosphotransferase family protein n=1 Tax=Nonomuraea sp. KM88 TaxID=3457427 RepID=UPI003FCEA317
MDDFEPTRATLAAIAARHGSPVETVRPTHSGVANRAYLLGDDLVLRIPRTERFLADLAKEAAVIPAARRLGVRTPDVVTFDDTCTEVDVPYMVLERVRGADLERLDLPADRAEQVYRQVGRELARLHRLPSDAGLSAVPRDGSPGDPRVLVDRLRADGWIDADAARWLTGWFDALSPYVPAEPPMVLVHGDIAPQNLLAAERRAVLTGIVDWGDAQWADPAIEFAKTPLSAVPAMLDGYSQEAGEGTSVRSWEGRVLWVHLAWALGRLADPVPKPGERHWTAPPASRLLGLLRFFASDPPSPWADLVRAAPPAPRSASGEAGLG